MFCIHDVKEGKGKGMYIVEKGLYLKLTNAFSNSKLVEHALLSLQHKEIEHIFLRKMSSSILDEFLFRKSLEIYNSL